MTAATITGIGTAIPDARLTNAELEARLDTSADGGYAKSYRELIEATDWSRYGRGKHPKCANCMAHCGYEPTAVMATMSSPREVVRAVIGQ